MNVGEPTSSTIIFPIAKVVVAGDAGVGKTSLIRRYCTDKFEEVSAPTEGVDFQIKIVDVGGKSIKLSLWDIAGQEKFGAFRDTYYRGAKAVALVYDLTRPATMETLGRWHAEISHLCPTARFLVAGNKSDLPRQVERENGEEWARSMNIPYIETSALANQNVTELFEQITRLAIEKRK